MASTLTKVVTVQPGGIVQIQSDDFCPGARAEVVVITDLASNAATWEQFIGVGMKNARTTDQIDQSIRELRDEWPR
jgi:hypothetical protein